MKLTFYGGTGEATGSNYILESGGTPIMIDCGLHQGGHYAETENFEPFAYDPKEHRRGFYHAFAPGPYRPPAELGEGRI